MKKNGRTCGGGRRWGPCHWWDVCERGSEKLQAGCTEEESREPVASRMHEIEGFVGDREHLRVARLRVTVLERGLMPPFSRDSAQCGGE